MFTSIRTKIAVPVLVILVLLVAGNILFATRSFRNFSAERSQERIQGASQAAYAHLIQMGNYSRMTARALAGDEQVANFITAWNNGNDEERHYVRQELYAYLRESLDTFQINSSVISDINGNVILRVHDFPLYGDSGMISPVIYAAHYHGEVTTTYSSTDMMPMAISSAAPVTQNGEIIGSVAALRELATLDFVDTFSQVFNAEVTVFRGYTSVASTLYRDRELGIRAVNTHAQQQVRDMVLEQGLPFDDEIELFGALYHGFYFPLTGWDDYPVGMFFIGFSKEEAAAATDDFVFNLILIGSTTLLAAAIVMIVGVSLSSRRVTHLAKIVNYIANGGEFVELPKATTDEVGVLTRSISTLMNTIETLSSSRTIIEIHDHISEKESKVVAAEAANKAKSEFLSTMSHEIRTPIGAILGITEIQLRRANDKKTIDPIVKEAFEKIHTSGELLMHIISDILDLSKIEAGKMELYTEKYEFASLIGDTTQLNILQMGSRPINFSIEVDENCPSYLIGDELRIKQILNNILSNAFKYTSEGTIRLCAKFEHRETATNMGTTADAGDTIATAGDGITLVFTISDTGTGMTEEQVDEIFDEFTRFNHAANREAEGTGLGMSIVKYLVKMMDGDVSIQSKPGEGSTFTVRLFQKIADPTPIGKETTENLKKFKHAGQVRLVQTEWEPMPYGKVLVVDDIGANIYVAQGFLEPYLLQVDAVKSGFAAIDKIKAGAKYDLILMDHMMPQMDGIETVHKLRDMGYDGPIAALTANVIVGHAESFLSDGFDAFLSKPIQSMALDAILKKYVRDSQPQEVIDAVWRNHIPQTTKPTIDLNELRADFAKSQYNVISEIKTAMATEDLASATLLAHTLKGLAGLIEEMDLMSLARQAEAAFRSGVYPKNFEDILIELESELARVLAAIASTPAPALEVLSLAEDEKWAMLENLRDLLEQNSGEVINMLPALRALPHTEGIIGHIENFNFELALTALDTLRP